MTTDSGVSEPSADPLGEARRWVLKLRSGEASDADVDALNRWRALDPEHRRAFAQANAQWEMLQVAARTFSGRQQRSVPVSFDPGVTRFSRRALLGGAVAASAGGAFWLGARSPFGLWPSLSELTADYRTDIGEQRQLALSDRVAIEMNTRTSLLVTGPRSNPVHGIELVAGQIAVTTMPPGAGWSEPFVVVAGRGRVEAERARFDLRYDEPMVTITCFDGEVQVECAGDRSALGANDQIAYGPDGLGQVAPTGGYAVEAWRSGLLVFENVALSKVIPEINRYRRGRIFLMNDEIGHLPLDATFRLDRIDEVVPKIAQLFNLKLRALPGGVFLLG